MQGSRQSLCFVLKKPNTYFVITRCVLTRVTVSRGRSEAGKRDAGDCASRAADGQIGVFGNIAAGANPTLVRRRNQSLVAHNRGCHIGQVAAHDTRRKCDVLEGKRVRRIANAGKVLIIPRALHTTLRSMPIYAVTCQ